MIPLYPSHPAFIKIGPIHATRRELRDLAKAWAAISLAFAILLGRGAGALDFLFVFAVAGLTVGLGFLLHELAHKIAAQRFGCFEEFIADQRMLLLAVLMSFAGFVFAAPGAVYISGNVTRKSNGIISAAGPATNLLLVIVFIILPLGVISRFGASINGWLAFFNLIPFGNLDGSKVWRWNKIVYAALMIPALLLAF